jgi:hypothetical protein
MKFFFIFVEIMIIKERRSFKRNRTEHVFLYNKSRIDSDSINFI